MNRSAVSQRISSILNDIQRLQSALYAMNATDIQRYPDNYEVLSTDAALRAETVACRLRHLLYVTTGVRKSEYLTSAAETQGVEIRQRGGIVEITLPCLLPKRKQSHSTEYLIDPLTAALERYVMGHAVQRFRRCTICFSHNYSRENPERRVRDYDNLEVKQILDAVLCDVYHTTKLADMDCTRIFVMDTSRFPVWLDSQGIAAQAIGSA